MSTPGTTIYLCSGVPLNNRYDHTLYFATKDKQMEYFSGKVDQAFTAYSYVRKSWKLKVASNMNRARVWSYLFFHNGTAGKVYFYFINQVEYINDSTVELTLELDVMQTYMFDWELRPCYVEREHIVTDTVGANTIDEGLDVGEYVTVNKETIDLSSDMGIFTAATFDINKFYVSGGETEDKILGTKYGNIFGGFQVTVTPLSNWRNLAVLLNYLDTKGKTDAIFTIWQYPRQFVTTDTGDYEEIFNEYITGTAVLSHTAAARPDNLGGYEPVNRKLYQYPYCFMYATNNNGGAAVYHYERFSSNNRTFRIQGNISPDAVIKLVPVLYKGVDHNYDEALTMGGFPMCAWNSDSYKMWLAQNQNQENMGIAMAGLKIVGGVAAIVGGVVSGGASGGATTVAGVGAGVSMISSGVTNIGSQLAQRADRDVQPPQARGTFTGSHNVSNGIQNFDIYHKTIDAYHAKVIDNYFTMYGYATRTVKKPNISSRPVFNYVRTIGSNVGGDFCQEDLKQINDIFDRGITFWKTDDIGNYSLDNRPK